jgi:DNA (cytosine-5)-methyltransferase 1
MRYLSVCSGIEAATVAWEPLGWKPVGFSEIEQFPCEVLQHHYPETKNYGDMTKHEEWDIKPGTVALLAGGTPCQAFSVAGAREGMADARGKLALAFVGIAARLQPRWLVWENVVGVLSSNGGRDFGAFLRALGDCGYGWCYRVLDARYFGVAQSRRRVFLVAYRGDDHRDWRNPAAVLFDQPFHRALEYRSQEVSKQIVSTSIGTVGWGKSMSDNGFTYIQDANGVRLFTATEVERLMGFQDGYTDIIGATDSKRYKALGNSWCVPVARWVGKRIQMVEDLLSARRDGLQSDADRG